MNIYSNNIDYILNKKKDINNYISNNSLFLIEEYIKKDSSDIFIYKENILKKDLIYILNLKKIRPNLKIKFIPRTKSAFAYNNILNLDIKENKNIPLFDNNSFFYENPSLLKNFKETSISFRYNLNQDVYLLNFKDYINNIQDNKLFINLKTNILSFNRNNDFKLIFNKNKSEIMFKEDLNILFPRIDLSQILINKSTTTRFNKKEIENNPIIFINKNNKSIFNNKIISLNKKNIINPDFQEISKIISPSFDLIIKHEIKILNIFKIARHIYIETSHDLPFKLKFIQDNFGQVFEIIEKKNLKNRYLYKLKFVFS
jgi:hypothetical protein